MAAFRRPLGQPFFKQLPGVLDVLPSTGVTPDTLVPQYDYPLPPRPYVLTPTQTNYSLPPFYAAQTAPLTRTWPLPPRTAWRPDTFVYPNLVIVQTPVAVTGLVGQYDYPLPPSPVAPISTRTWINPPIRQVIAPPIAQYDWPVPQRPRYAISLRTWINPGIQTTVTTTMTADPGSYSTVGTAATFTTVMPAAVGTYSTTGSSVNFPMPAGAGTYSTTGSVVTFTTIMPAAAGSYSTVGQPANLVTATVMVAAGGTYLTTGTDAVLTPSVLAV